MTFYQVVEISTETYESRYEGKSREKVIAEYDKLEKANSLVINKLVFGTKNKFYQVREVYK